MSDLCQLGNGMNTTYVWSRTSSSREQHCSHGMDVCHRVMSPVLHSTLVVSQVRAERARCRLGTTPLVTITIKCLSPARSRVLFN